MAIKSFKDERLQAILNRKAPKGFPIQSLGVLRRKLVMMDHARALSDLKVPPGNRLEPLAGDRRGQYSIRVNDQFRICFVWTPDGPSQIELIDYH